MGSGTSDDRLRRVLRCVLLAVGGVGLALLLAACHPETAPYEVNATADVVDANPGDGVCQTATPGQCTLRAAVMESNAHAGPDVIHLQAGTTYPLAAGDGATAGSLDVDGAVTVHGDGATIDAGGHDRAVHVLRGTVELIEVTLTDGRAPTGGGVQVAAGATATLTRSTVEGNESTGLISCGMSTEITPPTPCQGRGGGAGIWSDGTLHLRESTVSRNHAIGGTCAFYYVCYWSAGAGVFSSGGSIINSTIAANVADGGVGAGLAASNATTAVVGSTIHGNVANDQPSIYSGPGAQQVATCCDGGLLPPDGTVTLHGSIVSGAEPQCTGAVQSLGHNLSDGTSCTLDHATDRAALDPLFDPLGDHGGATETLRPRFSSPARDAIPAGTAGLCDGTLATDQRGLPRPDGPSCDIGAVEGPGAGAVASLALTVTHSGDAIDGAPGDGTCQDAGGTPGACSLRAAVLEANAWPAIDTITIASGVDPVLSLAGQGEDEGLTGDIDITDPVSINGAGATVDAAGLDRALHTRGVGADLAQVTITGGALPTASDEFNCYTRICRKSGGGGVLQEGGSLTVLGSTFAGNTAASVGGGLMRSTGSTWIAASTFSGNVADEGGALELGKGSTLVISSTLAGNQAPTASAIRIRPSGGGPVSVVGSVLDNPGSDCWIAPTSGGGNVVDDTSCGLTLPSDQQGVASLLGPLADNGGLTPTHLPQLGSPAVDATPIGTSLACDGSYTTDQRGAARPAGPACDAGAVEGASEAPLVPLDLLVTHGGDALDSSPGDGACQDADGAPGACSLRAAILEANASPSPDRISIAAGVDPTLSLTAGIADDRRGDLDITDDLTLEGGGATIDAAGIDRVMAVAGADVTLHDLTITGGVGGGLSADGASSLVVRRSHIEGNLGGEGAVTTYGPLILDRTQVVGNTGSDAGGLMLRGPSHTIVDSTISRNRVGNGTAGVYVWGPTTIERSTISDNTGSRGTGALTVRANTTLTASTIVGNLGGRTVPPYNTSTAISVVAPSTLTMAGSLVDNPTTNCSGTPISSGHNVVGDSSCALTGSGDQQGVPADVAGLQPNGGPTDTHLPFADSPAVDAIPAGTPGLCEAGDVDQRGVERPVGSGCDAGAVEGAAVGSFAARSLVVNHGGDDRDGSPGDGACQDAGGAAGACSLRAALDEVHAWPGADEIHIASGVDVTLARPGADEDANATGDLDVWTEVTIHGGGATVDAAGLDRVIHAVGVPVEIEGITITGGVTTDDPGAGLRSDGAALTVRDATITGNTALGGSSWGHGGGLASLDSGIVELDRTTVAGNAAVGAGGGLVVDGGGEAVVRASTFSGNEAQHGGAIARMGGHADIERSTLSGNHATGWGGAIYVDCCQWPSDIVASTFAGNSTGTGGAAIAAGSSERAAANVRATIFSGVGADCSAILTSLGHNVSDDASCQLTAAGDQPSTNPLLAPLADNGGPTQTHLPVGGSPVVDAIPSGTAVACDGTLPTDQRGEPRPAGAACDIGAVEGESSSITPLSLLVTHGGDARDADPGDGSCQDEGGATGACSLRAAVDEANAHPTADTITIAPGVDPTLTRAGAEENGNATGDLDLTGVLTIEGGGATLDAAGLDRVLDLHHAWVVVRDVTVTGGQVDAAGGTGGGIRQQGGALVVERTTLADNSVAHDGGGGIAVADGSTTIDASTVTGNSALSGGGLASEQAALVVRRSTISGNAGAAWNGTGGTATFTASTIVGHAGSDVAALHPYQGTMTLAGTIVANNMPSCDGTPPVSGGHNLTNDTSCALTAVGDQQGTQPSLMALLDNGGPTRTHLPLQGSAVVDAIPPGTAGLCDASPAAATDQRGVARPAGTGCDIGAVEGQSGPLSPLALSVTHGGDAVDLTPGDGTCQDAGGAPGACSLRAAIGETNAHPTADTISLPTGLVVTLARRGADDTALAGDLDITDDLTIDGQGATVDAAGIDRVVDVHGADVSIDQVVLRGGNAPWLEGGGLRLASGSLALSRSTVTASSALHGGGVDVAGGTLSLVTSTISGNRATRGAGLYVGGGTVTVTASTISSNAATAEAGAIHLSGGTATLTRSTVRGNTSGPVASSGLVQAGGTLSVRGTVLANSGRNCNVAVSSAGYNVSNDATCGLTVTGDRQSAVPQLADLAANGGPTLTNLPSATSALLDRIPWGTTGLCDATTPTDQRGEARPSVGGGACDIGAVERQPG